MVPSPLPGCIPRAEVGNLNTFGHKSAQLWPTLGPGLRVVCFMPAAGMSTFAKFFTLKC